MLANLLNNAIKFTPNGGQVSVSLTGAERGLQIAAADTGQGIAPDFLARMFHRFQQQDGSRTRRHGGLGLALAIARHRRLRGRMAAYGQAAKISSPQRNKPLARARPSSIRVALSAPTSQCPHCPNP